jgi:hypothetical protein
MNSVLTMTQRKNPNLNGSGGNGHGSDHGAMINALRKLYDPTLEEPVPEFLLRAASMTRDEAQRVLAKREDDAQGQTAATADKRDSDPQL